MKTNYLILGSYILLITLCSGRAERLVFPLLTLESQSNVVVQANHEHPKPCPPKFTNLISNPNLFTSDEQKRIKAVSLKYRSVTTNSGPRGSVFVKMGLRQEIVETQTNTFWVACFSYTNSNAREEIRSSGPGYIVARYRTPEGDGYDLSAINGSIFAYQEYKKGQLDGLFVGLHDPNNPEDQEHCRMWARFTKGKIQGKFLSWGAQNEIIDEAEFSEPFDFLKHASTKLDLGWKEALSAGS